MVKSKVLRKYLFRNECISEPVLGRCSPFFKNSPNRIVLKVVGHILVKLRKPARIVAMPRTFFRVSSIAGWSGDLQAA